MPSYLGMAWFESNFEFLRDQILLIILYSPEKSVLTEPPKSSPVATSRSYCKILQRLSNGDHKALKRGLLTLLFGYFRFLA